MAWTTSDRKSRLPGNWDELRAEVMRRCGGRCETIKANGRRCWDKATDVDHVIPGDDHRLSNLAGICEWHHRRKSSAEGVAARRERASVLRRPPEKHPGLLDVPITPPPNKGF